MRTERQTRVRWREWGEAAFREAAERGVPVLLDISAVWCHWCHVMDDTTYADPEVARLIEEHFVPVRVDNDRRPDVNRRYNMGGWPTTAFLAPSGEILAGGTYFPPETMRNLLEQVASAWRERREELERRMAELRERRGRGSSELGRLDPSIVERIVGGIAGRYDPRHGGFGPAPKFPHPHALELLLHRHLATGEEQLRDIVFHTLDAMAGGGMYDHVEGGFFRYSTTEDWSVPHFEKMCEDHARLLRVYLAAGTLDERFHKVAADAFRYVGARLTDPEGGFYGSQDADEEYYRLTDLEARRRRGAPVVDRTLYADWNGLMARAHFLGARLLPQPELRELGLRALDRILGLVGPPREGVAHYWDGGPGEVRGLLGDHAELGLACVDAYAETGDRRYLEAARELAGFALRELDPEGGGFLDRPPGPAEGALAVPARPLQENAAMATLLVRLGRTLRDEALVERARRTLAAFAGGYHLYDLLGAPFALAVDEVLTEPVHVSVVGPVPEGAALREAALAGYCPYRLVDTLDPARDGDLLERAGFPPADRPVAYICVGTACHPPTADPAEVARLVASAR